MSTIVPPLSANLASGVLVYPDISPKLLFSFNFLETCIRIRQLPSKMNHGINATSGGNLAFWWNFDVANATRFTLCSLYQQPVPGYLRSRDDALPRSRHRRRSLCPTVLEQSYFWLHRWRSKTSMSLLTVLIGPIQVRLDTHNLPLFLLYLQRI